MITFEQSMSLRIGLNLNGFGIGDDLILSSLPENFYKNTGRKMVGYSVRGILDHNPFIERDGPAPDFWVNSAQVCDAASLIAGGDRGIRILSIPDKHRYAFGLPKCYLRHPRLYIFEDSVTQKDKICIHTTGSSIGGRLSDDVISQIKINYKDYKLVQVGGVNDKIFPGSEDKRGLNLFDTAKEISESAIFIGVDSSNLHIASCYPRVRKKLVLNYFSEKELEIYSPLYSNAAWWEFNIETYCNSQHDIGAAMSYLKI